MTEPYCPDQDKLVEDLIDRVLTQYRESPKLLHMLRTYLHQVTDVYASICDLPEFFDLDTAVGEQLTWVGERMGWGRCHCVCTTQPVFGFACSEFVFRFSGDNYVAIDALSAHTITGLCDGSQVWADCRTFEDSTLCLDDDEVYRTFLKVRRYQMLALYARDDLLTCIRMFWGPTAWIVYAENDQLVLSPGRELTDVEWSLIQLYPRVLPVAPGIRLGFWFGTDPIFGFGEGWGDLCEIVLDRKLIIEDGRQIMTEGPGLITGPLRPWRPIVTESRAQLITENGNPLSIELYSVGTDWLCPVDIRAYECPVEEPREIHGRFTIVGRPIVTEDRTPITTEANPQEHPLITELVRIPVDDDWGLPTNDLEE